MGLETGPGFRGNGGRLPSRVGRANEGKGREGEGRGLGALAKYFPIVNQLKTLLDRWTRTAAVEQTDSTESSSFGSSTRKIMEISCDSDPEHWRLN